LSVNPYIAKHLSCNQVEKTTFLIAPGYKSTYRRLKFRQFKDLDQATQVCASCTDILLIGRDYSDKDIEYSVSYIADGQSATLDGVIVFRDVTGRKILEEQVRQAKKMEAIGRLAGGVAHALNNLMTAALCHSEIMIAGMKPSNSFITNAREIKKVATRTSDLTQKLLAFSRKQLLNMRRMDLNAVVGRVARIQENTQCGDRLTFRLEPLLGSTRADPIQLDEALFTLVRNACEAMPHGGPIIIETANVELGKDYANDHPEIQPGPYVLLAVSDTGVGMGQEAISHLFEPFNTHEAGVGAGLGLAALYGFVKQCCGDVEVRSQPDEGTTLRLYFPRDVTNSEVIKSPGL
jgi:signal transduction histidine kinase